ncbi:MAG: YdeI/OmpD-associated family protein [Nanoarchaeota archaeon]|nr:YdeI/OmpD-associated family protein [Nanoarchaeota archaeon]
MDKIPQIIIHSREEWRAWLEKNHLEEKKVQVIHHKKHTGKGSMSHREGIEEALCFGWIDTIINKLDEETYMRTFIKRGDKANWSTNTLSYAKKLLKEGKMHQSGIKRYKEGLKKKPHDLGRSKNPEVPEILKIELKKDKKIEEGFNNFSPSYKRSLIYYLLSAKLPETQNKRVKDIINRVKANKRSW